MWSSCGVSALFYYECLQIYMQTFAALFRVSLIIKTKTQQNILETNVCKSVFICAVFSLNFIFFKICVRIVLPPCLYLMIPSKCPLPWIKCRGYTSQYKIFNTAWQVTLTSGCDGKHVLLLICLYLYEMTCMSLRLHWTTICIKAMCISCCAFQLLMLCTLTYKMLF